MFNYTQLDESQAEFIDVGPAAGLPSGERLFVDIGGRSIVIFNVAGELSAIADVCSHDDGPLGDGGLQDFRVSCPRHGAEFDVRTGRALQMPAVVDIPAYPVRVVQGVIQLGIPKT
ncbi:MAG TPA: non-heme iron oxygenase ferredoxin subunit [Anaerolineales bacterium]|nr:non-heme iron oxygenase ferredoxin subunit [Anaerolineales bacterium]